MIDLVTEFKRIARLGLGAMVNNDMDYRDPDTEDHDAMLARAMMEERFPVPITGIRRMFGPEDIVLPEPTFDDWGADSEVYTTITEDDIIEEFVLPE